MTTPIKFSVLLKPDSNQPALDRAAQYARINPEIEVVAVRIVNEYTDDAKDQIKIKEESNFELLRRQYSSIKNFSIKVVFDKNVPDTFIKVSKEIGASLSVISANKRNKIKDLFISTIDSNIMRKTQVPLLVVKSAKDTASLGHNVILAIDFTEVGHMPKLDDMLYESASEFAKTFDGKVHVASCMPPQGGGLMGGDTSLSRIVDSVGTADVSALSQRLVEEYAQKHGIDDKNVHILKGRLDDEIPRLCEQLNARMVCMGSSPRSTLFGAINSTASELVLEQIRGDVFVVSTEAIK